MTVTPPAIRFTVTTKHIDATGYLSEAARREITGWLWDVPPLAPVHLDLGPLRKVDQLLIRALVPLRCVQSICFESADWRLAQSAWIDVRDELRARAPASLAEVA